MPTAFDGGDRDYVFNFGQRPFSYTPPSGFVTLNTRNLPTPTIGATASTQASAYMNNIIWTGNGTSTRTLTGLNFQPDFVWTKSRSNAYYHNLYDAVRGFGSAKSLHSNDTLAEGTLDLTYGYVSAATSSGFSVADGGTSGQYVNENGSTYVAWNWKANGAGVSNTAGTITSTVSANTSAGFSVVTYASTTGTVGHGLGVAPAMIIMKARNLSDQWTVGHQSINGGSSPWNYGLALNSTGAQDANSGFWNNTAPTSTVFSQGSWDSGYNKVAYCFAPVAGYSAMGSYTGNGSDDGTFVFTGFRPRFLMVKRTDTTSDWVVIDSARNTYNAAGTFLYPNLSNAEDVTTRIDFVSNGFKWRTTAGCNNSGSTWIYMAVAENPFKYAVAR